MPDKRKPNAILIMAVSKILDNNLYLLNVITIGATVPSGNNSSTYDISNNVPSGYYFMESILVCTPNDNWIRANAKKSAENTVQIVFTNEFNGSITGNWKICLILERTSQ